MTHSWGMRGLVLTLTLIPVLACTTIKNDRLVDAAGRGDEEAVHRLLASGANPNASKSLGRFMDFGAPIRTALILAVEGGHRETVEALLDAGANPNTTGTAGRGPTYFGGVAPLPIAVHNRDITIVRLLIARGADGGPLLEWAAGSPYLESDAPEASLSEREEIVRMLLEGGADARGPAGGRALRKATELNRPAIAQMLQEAGAVPGPPSPPPSAKRSRPQTARVPKTKPARRASSIPGKAPPHYGVADSTTSRKSPPTVGWAKNPLAVAAYEGDLERVRALLEDGFEANSEIGGWSAMEAAANRGHTEIVKALIEAGADVKGRLGRKAMKHAILGGHKETARLLIKEGVDVKGDAKREFVPLAVRLGHPEMLEILHEAD